ncbi:MAG TPA: hypothetical protein VER55_09930 [Ardenticatenaceae bacterium]|nr:hypothetical protein [Ardenticatenaceae bacterium]
MNVTTKEVKSILTPQKSGFATQGPYPFTHTLSTYTGCAFGNTTCGLYCYAQFLPNWTYASDGAEWGAAVQVKANAAEALERTLKGMDGRQRRTLRIFMSSTTDPYQPIEVQYSVTRGCLEVFARYDDLDLLVVQSRAPLAARDFDLVAMIPYAWFSTTIETDDDALLRSLRGGPSAAKRFALIREAKARGIKTQIAVSPCLPYTERFVEMLVGSGVDRIVVDSFSEGDGARGTRTARSPYAKWDPQWREHDRSRELFQALQATGVEVGWSAAGFSSIVPRTSQPPLFQ